MITWKDISALTPFLLLLVERRQARLICAFAVGFTIAGAAVGDDVKSGNTTVTQCFREKAMAPCDQWKVSQEYCRSFKSKFFLDESRGCYGQRWSIPKGFYSNKHIAYHPVTETLILTVGRPGLVPGITKLTPGRELPKRTPSLYKEVKVRALFIDDFEQRVQRTKRNYESTGGLADTKRELYGLRVFDQLNMPANQYRSVFLFPPDHIQWYVRCLVKPRHSLEEDLKTQGGCAVRHNVDDRVYIEYWVENTELSNLQRINFEMTSLIRSFMVN